MWNIIKAQNYQTRGDNVVIYGFLACLLPLLVSFLNQDSFGNMTGSLYLVHAGEVLPFVIVIITLVLTTRICGWDYADKTMNYEVLAGHSRGEVYWGRIIASMLWGMGAGIVITFLPVLLFTVVNGWGFSISFKGALMRLLLLLFPMFRLVCEFALLTFLLRSCYVAMIIGWVLYGTANIITMIAEETAKLRFTVQLASANMSSLLNFENYTIGYIDGEDIMLYDTALDASLTVGSVVVSVAVGAGCLVIGYICFKKGDMI